MMLLWVTYSLNITPQIMYILYLRWKWAYHYLFRLVSTKMVSFAFSEPGEYWRPFVTGMAGEGGDMDGLARNDRSIGWEFKTFCTLSIRCFCLSSWLKMGCSSGCISKTSDSINLILGMNLVSDGVVENVPAVDMSRRRELASLIDLQILLLNIFHELLLYYVI